MTASMPMTECLTPETLAAFIDDRLDTAMRREVMNHLAGCDECRSELEMASEIVESEDAGRVKHGGFGAQRWLAAAAAAAAAAAIVFLTPARDYVMPSPMKEIVAAADALPERPTRMRLAETLVHRPARRTYRGGSGEEETTNSARMLAALARIGERPSARNLHARGVGELYNAHPDSAVAALEEAHGRDADDVAIALDYGAALYALGMQVGKRQELEAALAIFDDVLRRDPDNPTALFNRGIVLDALGRDAEAVQAYRRYLARDASSAWASEIRDYLSKLE